MACFDGNWPRVPRIMKLHLFALLSLLVFASVAIADLPQTVENLNPEPPRIVVATKPSRLMLIDGPPALVEIPATNLSFVVNTDWTVVLDRRSQAWFVLDGESWLYSNLLSSGDWRSTTDLPEDFLTLQVNSDWPQVARAMPPRRPESPAPTRRRCWARRSPTTRSLSRSCVPSTRSTPAWRAACTWSMPIAASCRRCG